VVRVAAGSRVSVGVLEYDHASQYLLGRGHELNREGLEVAAWIGLLLHQLGHNAINQVQLD